MVFSGKQVVSRIRGHIKKRGGANNTWFVGLGKDARACLFETHRVRQKGDCWVLVHAESSSVARRVKSHLMKKHGVSGGQDLKGQRGDFVYAYKKSAHTKP